MPEYLAPGVYVEEVSFRSKSIEGVSTTTTGFVGPCRYGPIDTTPDIITSLGEFERVYGDGQEMMFVDDVSSTVATSPIPDTSGTSLAVAPGDGQKFPAPPFNATVWPANSGATSANAEIVKVTAIMGDSLTIERAQQGTSARSIVSTDQIATTITGKPTPNFMWHAARAFFEEGGKRLYIARIYKHPAGALADDGFAKIDIPETNPVLRVKARFPGSAGNLKVRFTLRLSGNLLGQDKGVTTVAGLSENDLVMIARATPPVYEPYLAKQTRDPATGQISWEFRTASTATAGTTDVKLGDLMAASDQVRLLTASVTVIPQNNDKDAQVWSGIPLHPGHKSGNTAPDSIFDVFAENPQNQSKARTVPITITPFGPIDGSNVLEALYTLKPGKPATVIPPQPAIPSLKEYLLNPNHVSALDNSTDEERTAEATLEKGHDGNRPGAADYEGEALPNKPFKKGLKTFEDLEDISIVAAPGSTYRYNDPARTSEAQATINALIIHATKMRYRIAVLDSGDEQTVADVRELRAKLDSTYAALYYPWVKVLDPITRREIHLPPSGFVAGIYARNDVLRGVFKAPANEVVNLAIGFETLINKSQQDILNPEGINCFRFFEGRGYRLWGARTISSDPEWKYVNLRRYFAYLERSIDRGTQWAVFEPNGEALWGNVRRTVEDFLFNEWQTGALLGDKPEKAFFVRCDRTTMTQNDLDNGRLVCLIGVAPLRPAEFVIFRIGQFTADSKR